MHWSYMFLTLTHRYNVFYKILVVFVLRIFLRLMISCCFILCHTLRSNILLFKLDIISLSIFSWFSFKFEETEFSMKRFCLHLFLWYCYRLWIKLLAIWNKNSRSIPYKNILFALINYILWLLRTNEQNYLSVDIYQEGALWLPALVSEAGINFRKWNIINYDMITSVMYSVVGW